MSGKLVHIEERKKRTKRLKKKNILSNFLASFIPSPSYLDICGASEREQFFLSLLETLGKIIKIYHDIPEPIDLTANNIYEQDHQQEKEEMLGPLPDMSDPEDEIDDEPDEGSNIIDGFNLNLFMEELEMSEDDSDDEEPIGEMEKVSVKSQKAFLTKAISRLCSEHDELDLENKKLKKELDRKNKANIDAMELEFNADEDKIKTLFFCRICKYPFELETRSEHSQVHKYIKFKKSRKF
jgi:hypothetical protein